MLMRGFRVATILIILIGCQVSKVFPFHPLYTSSKKGIHIISNFIKILFCFKYWQLATPPNNILKKTLLEICESWTDSTSYCTSLQKKDLNKAPRSIKKMSINRVRNRPPVFAIARKF